MKASETLVIQHRTDGNGQYIPNQNVIRRIHQHMMGGKVVDSAGETWNVRKGGDGRYYTTG